MHMAVRLSTHSASAALAQTLLMPVYPIRERGRLLIYPYYL